MVSFHVTVMSLDTIDEGSMVRSFVRPFPKVPLGFQDYYQMCRRRRSCVGLYSPVYPVVKKVFSDQDEINPKAFYFFKQKLEQVIFLSNVVLFLCDVSVCSTSRLRSRRF